MLFENMTGCVPEGCSTFPHTDHVHAEATPGGLLSQDLQNVLVFVNTGVFWVVFSIAGIATNIVNIICFKRMGFEETINISLFAMGISDMFSLIFLLWDAIWMNPYTMRLVDLPFVSYEFGHITGAWPHVGFIRVTGWITAFVTLERFLCIERPLKVKLIITPNRVKVILVMIYFLNLSPLVSVYLTHKLEWKAFDNGSKLLLALAFTENREQIENITSVFNQILSPLLTFLVVLIFTIALVARLKEKQKWRQHAAKSSSAAQSGGKDSKAAKMVTVVSAIFILCFLPTILGFVLIQTVDGFDIDGRLYGVYVVYFTSTLVLEGFNANVNFFIYFAMSSKFKQTCLEMFPRLKRCLGGEK